MMELSRETDRIARYYRNTRWHGALQAVSLLISLYLTAFLLSRLGADRFGLWGTLSAVFGFFLLLDLGIGSSFIHFFVKPMAAGDRKGLWDELVAGASAYLALVILLIPVGLLALPWFVRLMNVPDSLRWEAEGGYLFLLAAFAVRWVFIVYRSLLFAAERVDLLSAAGIGVTMLQGIATVWVVAEGGGLVSLGAIAFGAATCAVATEFYLAHRFVLPFERSSIGRPRLDLLLRQWRFGLKVQVVRLAEIAHVHLDKLLLAYLVALGAVASYEVGAKAATTAALFSGVLLPAVTPAAAQWSAAGQKEEVPFFYYQLMRWTVLIVLPLTSLIVFGAPRILALWLGSGSVDPRMVEATIGLAVGQAAYALTGPGRLAARGMGEPTEEMRASLLMAASSFSANAPLILMLGFRGAIIGTAGSMVIGSIYFLSRFHRRFDIPMLPVLQACSLPLIASIVIGFFVAVLDRLL